MSNSTSSSSSSGISFFGLLTLLFIALKLTGHIDWSWWWVLAPIWISFGLGLLVMMVMFVSVAIGHARLNITTNRERTLEYKRVLDRMKGK